MVVLLFLGHNWLEKETFIVDSNATTSLKPGEYQKNFFREAIPIKVLRFLEYAMSKIEIVGQFFSNFNPFPSSPPWAVDDKNWLQCT